MNIRAARNLLTGGALLLVLGMATSASASVMIFDLLNHPDGNQNPPPYGLRVDGLEFFVSGGTNGDDDDVWTFSFDDPGASMLGIYDDSANTFLIEGTAVGGLDEGSTNDPSQVSISFQYEGVMNLGDMNGFPVLEIDDDSGSGNGTLTFIDAAESIAAGTVVGMVPFANDDGLFARFAADDHRLDCPGDTGCGNPVFRGWVGLVPPPPGPGSATTQDGTKVFHVASQDWLLTTDVPDRDMPEPGTFALFGLGALALALRRRR